MAHDPDGALKQRLLSDSPPALSQAFESQTAAMLVNAACVRPVVAQGPGGLERLTFKPHWILVLSLGMVLALALKWGMDKSADDEELMRVDTLSMSTLLVL
jgi:hypothetical protein